MSGKLYLYPLIIRIWHFVNAVLILSMIATGISLQYSDANFPIINFALAVQIHNAAGIFLSINYLLFIAGNIATGNIRYYRLQTKGLIARMTKQFVYYTFGMFKGEKAPFPITTEAKFNPLQYTAYMVTMFVLVPIVIISGLALLFPAMVPTRILGFGGIFLTAFVHVIMGFFISIFLVIHLYFCTIGASPLSNFKSIITGYHNTDNH